jgi:hypothetical protein
MSPMAAGEAQPPHTALQRTRPSHLLGPLASLARLAAECPTVRPLNTR